MTPGARRYLARAGLVAMLVAATSPAWRLLLLGAEPTREELLGWRCSARTGQFAGVAPTPRVASLPVR